MTCGEAREEVADEILGRTVMVGQVPSGKTGLVVGGHRIDRAHRVYCAMGAGDLPHPVQDAADGEIGSELNTARCGEGHAGSASATKVALWGQTQRVAAT